MKFKFSNIKKNMERAQSDPYFNVKFQYKIQRIFIYFIMAIIAVTFITLILKFKSSGSYGNVVKVFMIFICGYMLYQIYAKTILPTKRIIQHYEASPQAINSKQIDVNKEVDDILGGFDKDGRRIDKT